MNCDKFSQVRSGLCSRCHYTCEWLESVHLKGLFADLGQIHFQLWADLILLQGFADLKYFVCDALRSRSWGQSQRLVRIYKVTDTLGQIQIMMWPTKVPKMTSCTILLIVSSATL